MLRCADVGQRKRLPGGKTRVPAASRRRMVTVSLDGAEPATSDVSSVGPGWRWLQCHSGSAAALAEGSHTMTLQIPPGVAVDQILLSTDPAYQPQQALPHTAKAQWASEKLYFSDHFMQGAGAAPQWHSQSGSWRVTAATDSPNKAPDQSANAFTFSCKPAGSALGIEPGRNGATGHSLAAEPAFALIGQPGWRSYTVEAAVRPLGPGPFGLAFCWQGPQTYYLFRCAAIDGASPDGAVPLLELVRVLDGKEQVLASRSGAVQQGRWYQIEVLTDSGTLAASVNGVQVLTAHDCALLAGKAGLFSAQPQGALFDDVLVRSVRTVREDFASPAGLQWSAVRGAWGANGDGLECRSSLPGIVVAPLGAGPQHKLEAAFVSHGGTVGLIYDYADARNYSFVAWSDRRGPAGVGARIVEVKNGRPAELAASGACYAADRDHTITVRRSKSQVQIELDGQPSLRAPTDGDPAARVGVYAESAPGAVFRRFTLRNAQEPGPRDRAKARFTADSKMGSWANPASEWRRVASGRLIAQWSNKRYYGDCAVTLKLQSAAPRGVVVAGDGSDLASGYSLLVTPKGAAARVELSRRDKVVKTKELEAAPARLRLEREGPVLIASVDGRAVFHYRDARPLRGSFVAAFLTGGAPHPRQIEVSTSNVDDFFFGDAPVRWRPDCGQWDMTNRWDCRPQWSWYGAKTSEAAILWNRASYLGDQSIDLFASFKMLTGRKPYYRTGDLNLTFCADGRTLGSGYTLLYGAWGGGRTALLRRGQVVAQTDDPRFLPPQIQDSMPGSATLHHRWFWLNLTREGQRILCFIDGVKAFEYEDPEPLTGGRFAVWTLNNWMMIPRVRVAYGRKGRPEWPLVSLGRSASARHNSSPRAATLLVTSAAFPCIYDDFEHTAAPWTRGSSDGVQFSRVRRTGGGSALRLRTLRSGLQQAAVRNDNAIDLRKYRKLSFDYRATPDATLHFYLRIAGQDYAVQFAGPIDRDGPIPVVATVPAVVLDGRWHRADLRLAEALGHALPAKTPPVVERVSIGNLDFPGYSYEEAGIGANPAGTTLELDNLRFHSPAAADPAFAFRPSDGPAAKAYELAFSQNAAATPVERIAPVASRSYSHVGDGTWSLRARAEMADGTWTAPALYPVEVDRTPPTIAAVQPPPGKATGASTFAVRFREDGAGIDWGRLRVSANGVSAGTSPLALHPQPARNTLVVDVERLPLALNDGDTLTITLDGIADVAGNGASGPIRLQWRISRRLDNKGPTILGVRSPQVVPMGSGFEDPAAWRTWRPESKGGVAVVRVADTAASGRHSLKVVSTKHAGQFAFTPGWPAFDANKYPILSFDYRAGPHLRTDLFLRAKGGTVAVKFLDKDNPTRKIGVLSNIVADNAWRHAELDLRAAMLAGFGAQSPQSVKKIWFADSARKANSPRERMYLDNFKVIPAVKQATPITWQWEARDVSGIAGYEYGVARTGRRPVWHATAEPHAVVEKLAVGRYDFLVKCMDGAGNVSVCDPIRFIVE